MARSNRDTTGGRSPSSSRQAMARGACSARERIGRPPEQHEWGRILRDRPPLSPSRRNSSRPEATTPKNESMARSAKDRGGAAAAGAIPNSRRETPIEDKGTDHAFRKL